MANSDDLLDVNVWLALAVEAHEHHQSALSYWDSDAAPIAVFCRVTQMAFLRLLTNKTVMGTQTLTSLAAWKKWSEFHALPEVRLFTEPDGLEEVWRQFCNTARSTPNLWTDAYLAAFAKCAGLRLVTFDKGFKRFEGLHCLIL